MLEPRRLGAIHSLIRFDRPIRKIVEALSSLPAIEVAEHDSVPIQRQDVEDLIFRFLRGELTAQDLQEWGSVVERTQGIRFPDEGGSQMWRFIFALANPDISEDLTEDSARRWLDRLRVSA